MEANSSRDSLSSNYLSILIDENRNLPSIYLTTKTVDETLQKLLWEYTSLNRAWSPPQISACRHNKDDLETEILYMAMIPDGIYGLRKGSFINLETIRLDEFYGSAIARVPRSIDQCQFG